MIEKLKILGLASAVAGLTMAASGASALSIFLEDNLSPATFEIIDGGLNDSDGLEDGRIDEDGLFGGFEAAATFGISRDFPPQDKLFGELVARLLTQAAGDITMSISHYFDNTDIDPNPGVNGFKLTQGLTSLEGMGSVETYWSAGDQESTYGTETLLDDLASMNNSAATTINGAADLNSYTITHVINLKSSAQDSTMSGQADYIAPVPVPAAGLLLLTALGGMGLVSRRRKSA